MQLDYEYSLIIDHRSMQKCNNLCSFHLPALRPFSAGTRLAPFGYTVVFHAYIESRFDVPLKRSKCVPRPALGRGFV